jgi:hypothetical protein
MYLLIYRVIHGYRAIYGQPQPKSKKSMNMKITYLSVDCPNDDGLAHGHPQPRQQARAISVWKTW